MWFSIVFALGLIIFLVFAYITKLYKFKGTKLKTRMNYALAVSIFFTVLWLLQTDGNMQIIGKGVIVGLLLSIPLCFYYKNWIEKRIKGTTIIYKRHQRLKSYLWLIPLLILYEMFVRQDIGKQILESKWPILGIFFSWFISQVFVLFYIIKIERKLGKPILEDEQ